MYYLFLFFFFVTATIEIYSLSLHDALPIFFTPLLELLGVSQAGGQYGIKIFLIKNRISHHYAGPGILNMKIIADRKSTRLNSSHVKISYAVFCLKKKNNVKK